MTDTYPIQPGVIFDHATRTADELDADTILLALDVGWEPVDGGELRDLIEGRRPANFDPDAWAEERAHRLSEAADDAVDHLGEVAPPGYIVEHDGEAGGLLCRPSSVLRITLMETIELDAEGDVTEGLHGVEIEGDFWPMTGVTGKVAKAMLDEAAYWEPLDDVEHLGPWDHIDDRGDEVIAYLADIERADFGEPYVRAYAFRTDGREQHEALLSVLGYNQNRR